MKVHYRILGISPEEYSVQVRYYTDILTEEKLCAEFDSDGNCILNENGYPARCRTDYNLTIYGNNNPSKEFLDAYIIDKAPIEWLKVKENTELGLNNSLNDLKDIIHTVGSFKADEQNIVIPTGGGGLQ
jgi:hypothetical protein